MLMAAFAGQIRLAAACWLGTMGIFCFGSLDREARKVLWGPFLFLVLMIPPSDVIMKFMTLFMQRLFALLVEGLMSVLSSGYVEREGFTFWFSGYSLPIGILPECSGLRSLIGLFIVATFFALWHRLNYRHFLILANLGIVLALGLNLLRIIITIELRLHGYKDLSVNQWHGYLGILVFLVGFLILGRSSAFLQDRAGSVFDNGGTD